MNRSLLALLAALFLGALCLGCGNDSRNKGINSNRDMPRPAEGGG